MKIRDLLPIGSIVLLKEGEKKLMIIGIIQNDVEDMNKTYDYLGVLYPEGHIGNGFQYLFNHEDINEIIFHGFEDDERAEFISKLVRGIFLSESVRRFFKKRIILFNLPFDSEFLSFIL